MCLRLRWCLCVVYANDALNKLIRKKYQWERRIKELGGPDYVRASNAQNRRSGGKMQYFGMAKNLPEAKAGEKEVIAPSKQKKRSREELQKRVNSYYLGDEAEVGADGQLLLHAERVSAKEAASALLELGVDNLAITLGSGGVLLASKNEYRLIPAIQVEAIDTTGAGDCFNGSLASELAKGNELSQSIEFACRVASISVTRAGAQDAMPFAHEVEI